MIKTVKNNQDDLNDIQQTLGWMDLVIGSIDDSVCVLDSKGSLVFVNHAFAQLIQKDRVFLLGKQYSDLFKAENIPLPVKEYQAAEQDNGIRLQAQSEIYSWKNAAGESFIFRIKTRNLAKLSQRVLLIQDITHEYSLVKSHSDIISLASHQLRTPITAIMTYSHMLHDGYAGELSKEQKNLTHALVTSAERMTRLIDDLLNIARIQNNKYEIKRERLSLNELINKVVSESAPKLKAKKLKVNIVQPAKPINIRSDSFILYEVFSNLLSNAIQYSHFSDMIDIRISTTATKLLVDIEDKGIGIKEPDQKRIFEQFFRSEEAFELYPQGTGLGMYLIKLMLEKLNGAISFRSKHNKGTTFTVCIPNVLNK